MLSKVKIGKSSHFNEFPGGLENANSDSGGLGEGLRFAFITQLPSSLVHTTNNLVTILDQSVCNGDEEKQTNLRALVWEVSKDSDLDNLVEGGGIY